MSSNNFSQFLKRGRLFENLKSVHGQLLLMDSPKCKQRLRACLDEFKAEIQASISRTLTKCRIHVQLHRWSCLEVLLVFFII